MEIFKKLIHLLSPAERRRGIMLMAMILVMAFLDMLGIASILPFMAVLANPEVVHTNAALNTIFTYSHIFGIETTEKFLFGLGVIVFVLLITSLAFKALTTYAQTHFVYIREYSIGTRLLQRYLQQPYSWYLGSHSAEISKNILSEVATVINTGMSPLMTLIAQGSVTVAMLILLLIVDPFLALSVGIVLGLAYGLIFNFTSGVLKRLGNDRFKSNQARYNIINEAFGAAKAVKVGGLEQSYIRRFIEPAKTYAKGQASALVIGQLPRFALEAIAFGGMLLVILYLMAKSDSFASALPVITLYAFAGYRLMPALQAIYGALTKLRFARAALDALYKDLSSLNNDESLLNEGPQLVLKKDINLKRVGYRYPHASDLVLKDIDLCVPVQSRVGLVGTTGSGKSTTVDILMGLLEPLEGQLIVDGQIINKDNRRKWQRAIGYVPQQIFLADDSVAANIAFGVEPKDIDMQAVEQAAKIANVHQFVLNDLPNGYHTSIGERGIRLSGGQLQRIGIARALYHKPQVLILDEATSALDNITEQAVMDAVKNLGHAITVVMIAHRLSTVRQCDMIYLMEKGEVVGKGTYEQLCASSEKFALMSKT